MAIKVQDWKTEADALEFTELQERQSHYTQLLHAKAAEHRKLAIAEVKELMAKHNVSTEDLAEPKSEISRKAPSAGRKMTPKYRDPANAENSWTGQGRAPKWMPENKDDWGDFLIKPEKSADEAQPDTGEGELPLTPPLATETQDTTMENAQATTADDANAGTATPVKRKPTVKRKSQPE